MKCRNFAGADTGLDAHELIFATHSSHMQGEGWGMEEVGKALPRRRWWGEWGNLRQEGGSSWAEPGFGGMV